MSIVNLGFGGKSKPKVGYATAMDVYIIICFFAVFAALVEFACINFIDTFIKRFRLWEEEEKARLEKEALEMTEKKLEELSNAIERPNGELKENRQPEGNGKESENNTEEELVIVISKENGFKQRESTNVAPTAKSECVSTVSTQDACVSTEDDDFEDVEEDEGEEEAVKEVSPKFEFLTNVLNNAFDSVLEKIFRKYSPIIPGMTIYKDTLSVIYSIDSFARKLFPLVFLLLQIMYWSAYLYLL